METRDILTMIGWLVSCILSILAGGWIIPRITKKKKILAWAVAAESELISREIHQQSSLPVSVEVGGSLRKSLSLVRIRLGNAGNEVLENIAPAIKYNPGASVLYIKPHRPLGEFQKCVEGKIEVDRVEISLKHLNPEFDCEFDILLSDYEAGSITVDLAAPGVTLLRRDVMRWEVAVSPLKDIGLSIFGLKYDPQVSHTAEIASELRAIRKTLQKNEK